LEGEGDARHAHILASLPHNTWETWGDWHARTLKEVLVKALKKRRVAPACDIHICAVKPGERFRQINYCLKFFKNKDAGWTLSHQFHSAPVSTTQPLTT
jgi:hypothetical protein